MFDLNTFHFPTTPGRRRRQSHLQRSAPGQVALLRYLSPPAEDNAKAACSLAWSSRTGHAGK